MKELVTINNIGFLTIKPNRSWKEGTNLPKYRISVKDDKDVWHEIGSAWAKKDKAGSTYLSASFTQGFTVSGTGEVYKYVKKGGTASDSADGNF